jgi:hypothetical protein
LTAPSAIGAYALFSALSCFIVASKPVVSFSRARSALSRAMNSF